MKEGVDGWKLDEKNLMTKSNQLFSSYRYVAAEAKNFMQLLMENGNAMGILLQGAYYENPCAFCASMFNNIAGECEIFNSEDYHEQTCQPRIAFGAEIINTEEVDLSDRSDYSKVLAHEFWNTGAPTMEV